MRNVTYPAAAVVLTLPLLATAQHASAETVVPFSQYLGRECGIEPPCYMNFPDVAAGNRLEIKHVSCEYTTINESPQVVLFYINVLQVDTYVARFNMVAGRNGVLGNTTDWVVDRSVSAPVLPAQHLQAIVTVDQQPAIERLACTVSGLEFTS